MHKGIDNITGATNVFPLIPERERFVSVYGNEKSSYVLSKTEKMEIKKQKVL